MGTRYIVWQAAMASCVLLGCWTTLDGPDEPDSELSPPTSMDAGIEGPDVQTDGALISNPDVSTEGLDAMPSMQMDSALPVDTDATMPVNSEIEWTQVEVGEWTFDVRMAGPSDGEPVLLLHGFPQTSLEFEAQILALADAGYRAIAPNQRGYSPGARPMDESAYLLPNLISDVNGLADALGHERYHLVGHDWGAMVAWSLAIESPDRLFSLTAISVPHPQPFQETRNDPESCQFSASMYFDFFIQPNSHDILLANDAFQLRTLYAGLPEHHIEDYLSVLTQENAHKLALDWYRANVGENAPETTFAAVEVPTLYVWGDADAALCQDGALLTENYVTGPYRFEIFEGVDHWVPETAADRLSAVLLEHLATYSGH